MILDLVTKATERIGRLGSNRSSISRIPAPKRCPWSFHGSGS